MTVIGRILVKIAHNKRNFMKFNEFRSKYMLLSKEVNEIDIGSILDDYETIIVGSDQIWNPGERHESVYFLSFGDLYNGRKISYAVDSMTSEVDANHIAKLSLDLDEFEAISVRNDHTCNFVKTITGKSVPVVVDPTILFDFDDFDNDVKNNTPEDEQYILVYTLGKEINGSNKEVIEKIKAVYGKLKVLSVVSPTMRFNICDYADKVFYEVGPVEWINLIKNASFVFTDSYHGALFSLKFRKPFLAYYAEEARAARFLDLRKRYQIDKFIVSSIDEIDKKESLSQLPEYDYINKLIETHKERSIVFLNDALNI